VSATADLIAGYLSAQEIPHARVGEDLFVFQLRGERKLTIPVTMFVRDRSVVVESFFMRNPIERHADVYRALLQRNVRARAVHFALGDQGDIYLVGTVSSARLDEHALDELVGEILTTADEMFDHAIATGFATYLERDLAWRARQAGNKS
jgi:hypothetical protein